MKRLAHGLVGVAAIPALLLPALAQQPCDNDADCAQPLTCRTLPEHCTQEHGLLPDGAPYVGEPVCQPGPRACAWVLHRCQADGDCGASGWSCALLNDQTQGIHICFPDAVDCSNDPCPADWTCVDFASARQADMLEMWPGRSSSKLCWPDVLAGVPDERTPVDPSELGLIGGPSSSGDGGSLLSADAGKLSGPDAPPFGQGKDASAAPVTPQGSGCVIMRGDSVTIAGRPAAIIVLAIVAVGMLAFRRRRN